ncbi:hypothetical protein CFC21_020178 [Triticum aestivum]|uniref:Uncharacterized protein n=2 Tax=Triticum aestivum TaxID=4565 RepID=A0A3B6B936_WHEAT|nr:hypothetical protein CFC21_020178 [Triticum aestivum]
MRRGRAMSLWCALETLSQRVAARLQRVRSAVMWRDWPHVRLWWRVTPWLQQRTTLLHMGWARMLGRVTGLCIGCVLVLRRGCTVRPGHGWVLDIAYVSLSRRKDGPAHQAQAAASKAGDNGNVVSGARAPLPDLNAAWCLYKCSSELEHLEGGGIKEQIKWAEALVAALEVENHKEMGLKGETTTFCYQLCFTDLTKC